MVQFDGPNSAQAQAQLSSLVGHAVCTSFQFHVQTRPDWCLGRDQRRTNEIQVQLFFDSRPLALRASNSSPSLTLQVILTFDSSPTPNLFPFTSVNISCVELSWVPEISLTGSFLFVLLDNSLMKLRCELLIEFLLWIPILRLEG